MDFSERIVKEIEMRDMHPKPRWHFLMMRAAFWMLAIFSVLIGGLSFAIAHFVFLDNGGTTHLLNASVRRLAQSIPFLWLIVLAFFSVSAYIAFRHTRMGYRHTTTLVVAATVLASVALGIALNTINSGRTVHEYLLSHTPLYDALIHRRGE